MKDIKNDIRASFEKYFTEKKFRKINEMRETFGQPSIHYQDPNELEKEQIQESFGFKVGEKEQLAQDSKMAAPVPHPADGSVEVAAGTGGYFGTYVDLEGRAKSEAQLVTKYRQMTTHPECDLAVQDVVNEAIIQDKEEDVVKIITSKLQVPLATKRKIEEEFDHVLRLLNFNKKAYDIFKQWYIDGRYVLYLGIDKNNPRKGIQETRMVDPRRITKVRQEIRKRDQKTGAIIYKGFKDYYIYFQKSTTAGPHEIGGMKGVKLAKDTICYTHSGVMDHRNAFIYSFLHKAIKPLNQLRMLEDAVVIYRLARAPERRIFYIDVGNMPKPKAEQYLQDMMTKHKNKLVYNAQTGEVQDDRRFMTMLEDFWLPRRGESGKATQIDTLAAGQNLGEMEDVYYFEKKLYKALGVPISRMESESSFNMGRSSEITRDEVKFNKYISRLRIRFSQIFENLLEIQLALKGVIKREEFKKMKQDLHFEFLDDNFYAELKNIEIWNERFNILERAEAYADTYLSPEWINKTILQLTDRDIARLKKQRMEARDIEDDDSGETPFETPKQIEMDAVKVDMDVAQNPQDMAVSPGAPPPAKKPNGKVVPDPKSSDSNNKNKSKEKNFDVKADKPKAEAVEPSELENAVIKYLTND